MRILLLLGFALVLISCEEKKQSAAGGPRGPSALSVEYVVITPSAFQNNVSTTAEIIPYEQVTLRAPVSGVVLNIYFQEGRPVKKGERLIQLDNRAWIAQLKGQQAELDRLQSDLERKEKLLKVEGATQQEVDQVIAAMAATRAQMEELRVNIDLAAVSAPFSGQVGLRNFSIGTYLGQGDQITTLAQVDRLKVEFNLPERYQNEVSLDQRLTILTDTDTVPATIYAIDPMVDAESRTLRSRAVIEAKDRGNLRPGVFATVLLPTQVSESAILVPSQAVVPEINDQTVYVVRDGVAKRQVVSLRGRNADMVEVISGLNPGDTVLTTGLLQVKDGSPVRLLQESTLTQL